MKKGITRKLVCVLMGVLSTLFLVSCGDVKLGTMGLNSAGTLGAFTAEIGKAHNDYVKAASDALYKRGVLIASDANEINQVDISKYLSNSNADIGEVSSILETMSRGVLITTGKNYTDVEGTMTIIVDDEQQDVGYRFFYGYVDSPETTDSAGNTVDEIKIGSELNPEWILWLDLEDLDLGDYNIGDLGVETVMGALFEDNPNVDMDSDTCGWVELNGSGASDGASDTFNIVWSGLNGEGSAKKEHLHSVAPAYISPITEIYGAYGLGVTTAQAGRSGDPESTLLAMKAMTSTSTFISPSNYAIGANYWMESELPGTYEDVFVRRATSDDLYLSDISNYSPWTWTGVSTNSAANTITAGHEVISSTIVDYGRIYTLSVESAADVADIQKLLYNSFGSGDTSLVITATATDGSTLDGSAGVSYFEPTEITLVPPGFGILCYSMLPREKALGDIDITTDGVGVVYPVGGSGTNTPSLCLGFLGPNEKVIDAMTEVLSSGGGGFAIINEKIYLMAYPVSAVNYLYTDAESGNAYLGIGPAPVYYNLIYDRLDYKYGPEYQFIGNANNGLSDQELYKDFNFVGGISYKDATTGSYTSDGGVGLLLDETNKPMTCKLQIAPNASIEVAKDSFKDIVDNYFVQPVPLYMASSDGQSSGNSGLYIHDADGVPHLAEDWLCGNVDGKELLQIEDGRPFFLATKDDATGEETAMAEYLDGWAESLQSSYLEVPQFILLNYVESTLLPGAAGSNNVAVTGRRIHLTLDAMHYDEENHLFYYKGNTSTKIGEYTSTDGSMKIADLYLGDVVDVRSLCGAGYTKQFCEDGEDHDFTAVQPPYGFNALFPIGTEVDVFMNRYETVEKDDVDTSVQSWVGSHLSTFDIGNLYTMSHWNGSEYKLGLTYDREYYNEGHDYKEVYTGSDDMYYQSASVVNNVAALTNSVTDGTDSSSQTATSIVSVLNISGADTNTHLGTTSVTADTLIEDLPYVSTDIITFSEPFPNTMFNTVDTETVFNAGSEMGNDTAMPNVMFTIAVGTGITKGNFFNAWVISDAPTDSLDWWNKYLSAHNYTYNVKAQTVQSYIETNYSYLANEANRLRVDLNSVEYWSETLDVTNPSHGGNFISNIIMTASNIVGVFCVFYSIICLLLWAVDIYAGFDKDFYRMVTGGRYVASAERLAPVGKTIYATFPNALGRSTVIFVAGLVLIFVGAGTLLALMFRFVAVILRIIFRYWN